MKRIYMILALVSGLAFGAKAQTIDLEAVIGKPTAGQIIGPGQTLDTGKIICGMYYTGPDAIFAGDVGWFMTSLSRPATDSTTYINGVIWNSDITVADSGFIFVYPNANQIGVGHTSPYNVSSDSIRGLYDWDQWNLHDSIVLIRPPYTPGKSYGFFFRALFIGDENANPLATDPTPANNRAVQRIVWQSQTGIGDLFPDKENKAISVYPNPAVNEVNFDFDFTLPSHASAIIRDISGRTVKAKNFGRTNSGVQKFSIDISQLTNGVYSIEFDTDTETATARFSVTK
jgi:hypothetical protein